MDRYPALEVARKGALAYVGAVAMTGDALTQAFDRLAKRGARFEQDARTRLRKATRMARADVAEGDRQVANGRGALEQGRNRLFAALNLPTQRSVEQLTSEVALLSAQIDELRETMRREAKGAEEPLPGYDKLNAERVVEVLPTLNEQQLLAVRNYEQTHNHRVTVLRAVDKQIEAKTAA
jgi:polyhydroxyalkanoate synthesis regulator phasin